MDLYHIDIWSYIGILLYESKDTNMYSRDVVVVRVCICVERVKYNDRKKVGRRE